MLNMLALFSDLNHRELDYLSQITEEVSFTRGEIIFSQGDMDRDFYIIRHGQVEISVMDVFHEKKVIRILKNGEFFGEMSLFEKDSTRSATAQAFQNTTLLKIRGKEFERLLKEQPGISFKLLGTMNKRLAEFMNPNKEKTAKRQDARARVVTIGSPRSGCGKTLCAMTLAHILAAEGGRKVLFLDLDLIHSDGTFLFGLFSPKTILEFANSIEFENIPEEALNKFVVKRAGGLSVMPGIRSLIDGTNLRPDELVKAINACRHHYDYLIIDTNSRVTENFLNILDMSDVIFFLIDCQNSVSIKSNSTFIKSLSALNLPDGNIHLLLNHHNQSTRIDTFRKLFKWDILGVIPEIPNLKMEVESLPFQTDPGGDFCNAMRVIAGGVLHESGLRIPPEGISLPGWFSSRENLGISNLSEGESMSLSAQTAFPNLVLDENYCFSILKEIRCDVYRGYLDRAQKDCLNLFSLFPKCGPVLQMLGEIFYLRGDFSGSLNVMNKALEVDPENYVALWHVGQISSNSELKERALEFIYGQIRRFPEYPDLYNDLGRAWHMFGDYSKARDAFEKALQFNPKYSEARINLALSMAEMNFCEGGLRHLKYIKPKTIRVYYLMGNLFYKTGHFIEALAAYERVREVEKDYFDTAHKFANLQEYFAKLEHLLSEHKRMAASSPNYPDIHFKIGNLYLLLGKRQEAHSEFQLACALKPDYSEARKKMEEIASEPDHDSLNFEEDGESPVEAMVYPRIRRFTLSHPKELAWPKYGGSLVLRLTNLGTGKMVSFPLTPESVTAEALTCEMVALGELQPMDLLEVSILNPKGLVFTCNREVSPEDLKTGEMRIPAEVLQKVAEENGGPDPLERVNREISSAF